MVVSDTVRNHLNRLLVVGIFCLPPLGLTGCSSYRKLERLTESSLPNRVVQDIEASSRLKNNAFEALHAMDGTATQGVPIQGVVKSNVSIADLSVDMAGGIGVFTMGVAGGCDWGRGWCYWRGALCCL